MDSQTWQRLNVEMLARFLMSKNAFEEPELEKWVKEGTLLKPAFNPKDTAVQVEKVRRTKAVKKKCRRWVAVISLVVLALIGGYAFGVIEIKLAPGSLLDGGPQFTVISLLVALAAYLATLGSKLREIINKAPNEEEYMLHQEDLAALLFGEKLVVISGSLITLRPLIRSLIPNHTTLTQSLQVNAINFIDFIVITVFSGIVIFLVHLHRRKWR